MVGLGLAMMTIISIAGESPESGIGVGGAIAILGAAFIVRSMVVRPEPPHADWLQAAGHHAASGDHPLTQARSVLSQSASPGVFPDASQPA